MIDQQTLPFVASSQTSREAALSMRAVAPTQRDRVLSVIQRFGPVSDQEVSDILDMSLNSVRPRRVELAKAGLIEQADPVLLTNGRRAQTWRVK